MPPPFRADHIGSLIRPAYLLEARAASIDKQRNATSSHDPSHLVNTGKSGDDGDIKSSETDGTSMEQHVLQAQHKAIREAVDEQLRRDITPITTGEYERWIFYGGFFEHLEGIIVEEMDFADGARPGLPQARHAIQHGVSSRPIEKAVDRVRWTKSAYMSDWLYLRSLLPRDRWKDAKFTLPSPTWFHVIRRDGTSFSSDVYRDDEAFLRDMGVALRSEILALYEEGVRVFQIDDPNLTFFCDEEFIAASQMAGTDLNALLDLYIRAHNRVLEGLPSDVCVGIHLCRGNYPQGVHIASGGYQNIAEKLLRNLRHRLYYLEFDTDRAGDFEPLAALPIGKSVVLGLITTKFAELENVVDLRARVEDAALTIAKGQGRIKEDVLSDTIAVSPQCGFASVSFGRGQGFTEAVMWQKLELVKELAALI